MDREGVNVMHHEVSRPQRDWGCSDLATNGYNGAIKGFADAGKCVGCCTASCCCMYSLIAPNFVLLIATII